MSEAVGSADAAGSQRIWPAVALRPPRVVIRRPEKPVPWAFTTADRVRLWDDGRGLIEFDDLDHEGTFANVSSAKLSADGLGLSYQVHAGGQDVHYSVLTGAKRFIPRALGYWPYQVHGPSGEVLTIERTDVRARLVEMGWNGPDGKRRTGYSHEAWGGRYTVTQGTGERRELPVTLPEGANQALYSDVGQFCDNGRLVAISHGSGDRQAESVSVTDWRSGATRSFDGVSLAANNVWSPDATRLLVGTRHNWVPQILHIETGVRSQLGGVFGNPWDRVTHEVIGWLDDDHLIVLRHRDRRLLIGAHELATGTLHPLLDTNAGVVHGEFGAFQIAPPVLHALPDPFGLPPRRSPR